MPFKIIGDSLLIMVVFGHVSAQKYKDIELSAKVRAKDLVSRMTLEEKISQMMSDAPGIERLGLQPYNWWNECLHGVARNGVATVFPQAIGLAATWNPDLIQKMADVIATEARAKHHYAAKKGQYGQYQGLTMWSPNINLFRDPRWGRGQETYGEDPYLTSQIGVAFVKGLQGENSNYFKVIATPKHYVVHSGPEPARHHFDAVVSKRDLFESYLPGFEALILDGGAYSIMGAYNRTNHEPCCSSPYLLDDILREKWGFDGYVVSDCGAIGDIHFGHKIADNLAEASAMAVKAGCDLTCGDEYQDLYDALDMGIIDEETIDTAVTCLMTARLKLGMLDPDAKVPYAQIPYSKNNCKEHDQLALKVARESMVLLKNDEILPLDKSKLEKIAVIGPYINDTEMQYGNYHGTASDPVSYLQGIKNKVKNQVEILAEKGVGEPAGLKKYKVVSPENLYTDKDQKQKGLKAQYFDNPELKGRPIYTNVETNMAPYWGQKSPVENIKSDQFSVKWTGYIKVDQTGKYDLGIITDDKGRLFVNGRKLVDNWKNYEINKFKSGIIKLEAGRLYPIKIEFAELQGYAGLRFKWRKVPEKNSESKTIAKAVRKAQKADVVIACCGISPRLEGEEMGVDIKGFQGGDRTSLKIPENQRKLLKKLHATGKPIVLVLSSGSALAVNWANNNVPAIVMAWYPGQRGGDALADILFGDYNPAGRLPVTFYESVKDLPDFEDYSMENRTYRYFDGQVLYPFGYGLSYSKLEYKDLKFSDKNIDGSDKFSCTLQLDNISKKDGQEVVQVYATIPESELWRENKRLVGFKKIKIKAGTTKNVEILIDSNDLRIFDPERDKYRIESGKYRIMVGRSSEDFELRGNILIE
ncbi:MAG: glycoside hydrolase family 3 C-terminal domain-containing protein [Clostridiales bacterium]|nr:glycoside hydrolase family 3 C-terminal domain-containing protein [Clostridiales bacterium]